MDKCMNTETDKRIRIIKDVFRCVRQSLREGKGIWFTSLT